MKRQTDRVVDLGPLEARAKGLLDWLEENGRGCFDEQEHIRAGTKGKDAESAWEFVRDLRERTEGV